MCSMAELTLFASNGWAQKLYNPWTVTSYGSQGRDIDFMFLWTGTVSQILPWFKPPSTLSNQQGGLSQCRIWPLYVCKAPGTFWLLCKLLGEVGGSLGAGRRTLGRGRGLHFILLCPMEHYLQMAVLKVTKQFPLPPFTLLSFTLVWYIPPSRLMLSKCGLDFKVNF